MGIPMLKTRQSQDRLIFNIGIPILVRWHLYIDTTPWSCASSFRWCVTALHHEGPVSYCGMTGITGWHVWLAADGLQWLEAEYQSLTLEVLSGISQNLISHCKCHVISKHICIKKVKISLKAQHHLEKNISRHTDDGIWIWYVCTSRFNHNKVMPCKRVRVMCMGN